MSFPILLEAYTALVSLTTGLGLYQFFVVIGSLWIGFEISVTIYNLFFHPLARFPGPPLALAFSFNLHALYYDLLCGGKRYLQLIPLHKKYGPVLRLGPNELWFSEPELFKQMYSRRTKLEKYSGFYHSQSAGLDGSLPWLCDLEAHRQRRVVTEKYWTKSAVLNREAMIWAKTDLLCDKLADRATDGSLVRLQNALRAVAVDIVTDYFWNKPLGDLATAGEQSVTMQIFDSLEFFQIDQHIPFAGLLSRIIPQWMQSLVEGEKIRSWYQGFEDNVIALINDENPETNIYSTSLAGLCNSLKDHNPEEKIQMLTNEAILLAAAGSDGPAFAMVVGLFYLLKNPVILDKLLGELKTVMPETASRPTFEELRRLPYLVAVVKETLRLSYGANQLPRAVPLGGIKLGETFVPGGTVVQMSAYTLHSNEDLFPAPFKFHPERFMGDEGRGLEEYLMNFSYGPAKCVGVELAMVEMYIILAAVLRRFEIIPKNDLAAYENIPWVDHSIPVLTKERLDAFVKLRVE